MKEWSHIRPDISPQGWWALCRFGPSTPWVPRAEAQPTAWGGGRWLTWDSWLNLECLVEITLTDSTEEKCHSGKQTCYVETNCLCSFGWRASTLICNQAARDPREPNDIEENSQNCSLAIAINHSLFLVCTHKSQISLVSFVLCQQRPEWQSQGNLLVVSSWFLQQKTWQGGRRAGEGKKRGLKR